MLATMLFTLLGQADASPASADPTKLLEQIFDAVHNGNGWLAAGPALSLITWALLKYDQRIPRVGPAIDRFLNLPMVAFMLPTVLSAATGLFSALAVHQPIGPALLTALKVSATAAFTFLAMKNLSEQTQGKAPDVGKAAPVLLAVIALGLSSCATTSAAAGVNTATASLDATGKLFLATAATLDAAYDAKMISELQYQPWRDFSLRFKAAYAIADKAMVAAAKSNDQTVLGVVQAEMETMSRELGTFQALAAEVARPTTGPPSGRLLLQPAAMPIVEAAPVFAVPGECHKAGDVAWCEPIRFLDAKGEVLR